jgi:hypothetical protein
MRLPWFRFGIYSEPLKIVNETYQEMLNYIKQKFRKILSSEYASHFLDEDAIKRCSTLTEREIKKTPKRYDIINYLLTLTENKRYLEIGVRNPADCFSRINATEKYSVDPGYESSENLASFKLTSDEFFSAISDKSLMIAEAGFGVIFLDGLHLADQAYNDMLNCMRILASPGFLVVHDCNPPTVHHAREDYHAISPAGPFWNGTTWKAFVNFRFSNPNRSFVVDTDWGVGVICKHLTDANHDETDLENKFFEFNTFNNSRAAFLNLIEFGKLSEVLSSVSHQS